MDKLDGSMEVLSIMQITADTEGLDVQSKSILRHREVLAVILQAVVTEYKGYSRAEIMDFIEADSITSTKEVSAGRTNTQVRADSVEFAQLNEKVSFFDMAFRAKNPDLSTESVQVSLHIDVESQKTCRPGYPIEKRGMYYLARSLSSQLSLVTKNTDYNCLEKCYSIWICRDDIPKNDRYSISVYGMSNTKNTGTNAVPKENYDLMTLVVIKLGDEVYNGEKGDEEYEILRFLNAIMYPHKEDFSDTMSEYIDFSKNEELWKEVQNVDGLGWSILEIGIRALVLENLDENVPRERIIAKLRKYFLLSEADAEQYYERFSQAEDEFAEEKAVESTVLNV